MRSLTTLNPVAYMWTGVEGARLHLEGVRGIDDRGGWSNHVQLFSEVSKGTLRSSINGSTRRRNRYAAD